MGEVANLLTPEEAAARLRVCTKTLGKLRRDGLIRYVAVTRRKILYRPQDCDAFAEARAVFADAPTTFRKGRSPRRQVEGNVVSFMARRRERRGA